MKKIIIIFTSGLLTVSCRESKPENTTVVETAAENTESSFSIKRMSNSQNILDGIYSELMKNDPDLQKLDEKVNAIQKDSKKMKELYSDVIRNSDDYYNIVKAEMKTIGDSLLRKEIHTIMSK